MCGGWVAGQLKGVARGRGYADANTCVCVRRYLGKAEQACLYVCAGTWARQSMRVCICLCVYVVTAKARARSV